MAPTAPASLVDESLRYSGLTLRISAPEPELAWLREFLTPWFAPSTAPPTITLSVTRNQERFRELLAAGPAGGTRTTFTLDERALSLPLWKDPQGRLALHDSNDRLFYLRNDSSLEILGEHADCDLRIPAMRAAREFATSATHQRGDRFLHAAAFSFAGGAAIITGPRGVGKTSLLTYVLGTTGASFITNDRLAVQLAHDPLRVRGMPTIVALRERMLGLFPAFSEVLRASGYRARATIAEAHRLAPRKGQHAVQQRRGLSPRQYCALLASEATPSAEARALVFPVQTKASGGIRLHRLSPAEARERLRASLFGAIGPRQLSETFTTLPRDAEGASLTPDRDLFAALATAVPGWECQLGRDSYRDGHGAEQLLALLDRQRSEA